jgi:hypothetical protein
MLGNSLYFKQKKSVNRKTDFSTINANCHIRFPLLYNEQEENGRVEFQWGFGRDEETRFQKGIK